jgi:hypothetical protein
MEEKIDIINSGQELWLAIEGGFTNLRIWKARIHPKINPDNIEGIYMRLDKANEYSVPLSENTVNYINNEDSPVYKLAKFTFPTSVDNLDEILEITKKLPIRKNIVNW